jgi:hypothetical protein
VEILFGIEVLFVFGLEMELVVTSIKLVKIIHWDVVIEFLVQAYACLIGPTSCNILDCISSST